LWLRRHTNATSAIPTSNARPSKIILTGMGLLWKVL
jgi:hypothetical protein